MITINVIESKMIKSYEINERYNIKDKEKHKVKQNEMRIITDQ